MGQELDTRTPEGRAAVKLGFLNHLSTYLVVNTVLAAINLALDRRHLWFLWPLGGWGVGVVLHAVNVFVFGPDSAISRRLLAREKRRGP